MGVDAGTVVTEEHLFRMLGMVADPITGEPLGRQPNRLPPPLAERVAARVAALPSDLSPDQRARAIAQIEMSEKAKESRTRRPVAGFDLTFSVPKSISAAWALADEATKAVIYRCHQEALRRTIAYAEAEAFHSRSGNNGVVEEDIVGVVAACFDHWDSRAGDPQLHTHVVVSNRAPSASDGKWRTLDSKGLFKQVVTLSEMHQGILQDLLAGSLGWGFDPRQRRHSTVPKYEVSGVGDQLLAEFSQRSVQIEEAKNSLVARFVTDHGRPPTTVEVTRLRQQATLATRPDKAHRSLAELTRQWRQRATGYVGDDPIAWVHTLRDRSDLPLLYRHKPGR
jgi:conjugative relaxase-like TrwC/TraI family protein